MEASAYLDSIVHDMHTTVVATMDDEGSACYLRY